MTVAETVDVALPVERAWALMTDLGRLAECIPGARVDEAVDGEWRGRAAGYAGTARLVERDEVDRRLVFALRGRNGREGDAVRATVTAALRPQGERTVVEVAADASDAREEEVAALLRGVAVGVERAAAAGERERAGGDGRAPGGAGPSAPSPRRRAVAVRVAEPAACIALGAAAGWLLGRRR